MLKLGLCICHRYVARDVGLDLVREQFVIFAQKSPCRHTRPVARSFAGTGSLKVKPLKHVLSRNFGLPDAFARTFGNRLCDHNI